MGGLGHWANRSINEWVPDRKVVGVEGVSQGVAGGIDRGAADCAGGSRGRAASSRWAYPGHGRFLRGCGASAESARTYDRWRVWAVGTASVDVAGLCGGDADQHGVLDGGDRSGRSTSRAAATET